jgi:hypothetical protein
MVGVMTTSAPPKDIDALGQPSIPTPIGCDPGKVATRPWGRVVKGWRDISYLRIKPKNFNGLQGLWRYGVNPPPFQEYNHSDRIERRLSDCRTRTTGKNHR